MEEKKGEITHVDSRELKDAAKSFMQWLENIRGSAVPGGEQHFLENKNIFKDTFKLWQLAQKTDTFVSGTGQDLNAEELRWFYEIDESRPMFHGLDPERVISVIRDFQGKRAQKMFTERQSLTADEGPDIDKRNFLIEHDMRKIFAPRDLGRIMILNNPNHTMDLEADVNTLVGGFHNTVGYREKFGNKLYPNLRLIVGHAHFSNMKDLGNLEEVTGWAAFDNHTFPEPERIERFSIKRIAGKDLTHEDIAKIISQETREFGRPKKDIQYSDLK